MKKIDSHIHLLGNHENYRSLLEGLDIKVLNICMANAPGEWHELRDGYRELADLYPDKFAWCTSFDPPDFSQTDGEYVERVIADLKTDFNSGAVACKIWKNIGMEAGRANGEYVMVDDPLFAPIFELIEGVGLPVLMHIGEPRDCWLPLRKSSPHYGYYNEHPQWHMYGRKGFPSHEELIAARDHVLVSYPGIRFVGAHLGSLEFDLQEIAKRLDEYPNFMVDTSARLPDLAMKGRENVTQFLTTYQDRVLYGSDFVATEDAGSIPAERLAASVNELREVYRNEIGYFVSGETVHSDGRPFEGLSLPEGVAAKILFENAQACYSI